MVEVTALAPQGPEQAAPAAPEESALGESALEASGVAMRPAATPQEVAAIVSAVELLWPQAAPTAGPTGPPSGWRFGARPWHTPTSWSAVGYR